VTSQPSAAWDAVRDSSASGTRARAIEIAAALALFGVVTGLAASTQRVTIVRFWDSDHYYWMTYAFAKNMPVVAGTPYVYRIGLPWLVSFSGDPTRFDAVYRVVNLAAAGLATVLLAVWLRGYVRSTALRLLLVALFVTEWHGPARFVHYYPMYVDPPMFALLVAGLLAIDGMRRSDSTVAVLVLAATTFVGTMVREVMVIVPIAALCVVDGRGYSVWRRLRSGEVRAALALLPLAAWAAALLVVRSIAVPRANSPAFWESVLDSVQKKHLFAWVLAWFFTFGPVIALLAYDWRRVVQFLTSRRDLGIYLAFFAAVSYLGGTDTERLLFWAMPVVYVLIGRAIEAQPRLFDSAALLAVLVGAQAISARIFWPIPNPGTNVAEFAAMTSPAERVWALLNRIIVIDDFHWNLWSTYGSVPAHALTLAWDAAFVALIAIWLRHRSRALVAARPMALSPTPGVSERAAVHQP
jgi:hypothetical protein